MAEVTTEDVLHKISQEHLQCSICFDRFKRPKILDCLHSFCVHCLEDYKSNQHTHGVKLPCPLCRRETLLNEEGIEDLKSNFNLTALVEEFTHQESLVKRQQSQIVCEVCEQDGANSRCIECKEYLCDECQKAHKRAVKTRKHETATLEDLRSGKASFKSKMRDEIPKCKKHISQDVCFFCKTCQVLICAVCTALDHSKPTHTYQDIEEAEKLFREEARILLAQVKSSTQTLHVAKGVIDHARATLESMLAETSADISKRADEDVARIREQESILKQQVLKIGIDRTELLKTSQESYCESLKWADHTLEMAGGVLDQSSHFELLELKEKLVKNLEDVSEQEIPGPMQGLSPFLVFSPGTVTTNLPLGQLLLEEKWLLKRVFNGTRPGQDEDGFKLAASIASFTTNDLIVADPEKQQLTVFNSKGQFKSNFDAPVCQPEGKLHNPYDVSLTKDDRVMVIDQPKNKFTPAAVKVFRAHEAKKIKHLFNIIPSPVRERASSMTQLTYDLACIAVDEHHIAVGNTAEKTISLYDTEGSLIREVQANFIDRRLTISNKQHLIFSNYKNSKLVSLDLQGKAIFSIDTVVNGKMLKPAGMCCDRSGDIYIVLHASGNYGSGEIHHYTAEGVHIRRVASGLENPLGLTITPSGALAVADMSSVKIYHRA